MDVDGAVNKHKVICRLCNLELPYSRNTTNLFASSDTSQGRGGAGISKVVRLLEMNNYSCMCTGWWGWMRGGGGGGGRSTTGNVGQ